MVSLFSPPDELHSHRQRISSYVGHLTDVQVLSHFTGFGLYDRRVVALLKQKFQGQPPKDKDDVASLAEQNLELIRLMDPCGLPGDAVTSWGHWRRCYRPRAGFAGVCALLARIRARAVGCRNPRTLSY